MDFRIVFATETNDFELKKLMASYERTSSGLEAAPLRSAIAEAGNRGGRSIIAGLT